jgi:4'-phosphopantetheinyl transferase
MRIEASRRRWIATRAGVRALLGGYVGIEPAAVAFGGEPRGKPRLEPDDALRFSVSHSGELALVAVASEREVGVDIEWMGQPRDALGLARRWFTSSERAAIEEAPEPDRLAVFYRHWVAKEAFVKATGRGLSASLRSFEVELAGPSAPRLVRVGGDELEAMRWSLELLDAPHGYAAALVAEAPARARRIAPYDPLAVRP